MNLEKIISDSSVIALVKKYKDTELSKTSRHLKAEEITQLEKQGNICNKWDEIKVNESFSCDKIFRCLFKGKCFLGIFDSEDSGLYNSSIINSHIDDQVSINNCGTISKVIIEKNVIIENTKRISCHNETTYGNGTIMSLAIESGGREVSSFSELTIEVASTMTQKRDDEDLQNSYNKMIDTYCTALQYDYCIIGESSIIQDSTQIINSILLPYTSIDGAAIIENCTVMSSPEEQTVISGGASAYDSIIQWGSSVDTMALVSSSVLCEYSHVERHGKISHSVLGPNSGVSEGEATSSLIGPFVGFHHQSMVIAALWPEGRGNIAYGVNCGSNHTGRLPDQEIHIGEGLFIGLGASIKYPANYKESPYSIIATGVTTLPQKISMPFSLIMAPTKIFDDQSPAYNEIRPGWLLSDNLYALFRNEDKYRSRDKSKRMTIDFTVLRPEIIDLITEARNTLLHPPHKREYYSDKDFPELGKNILLETQRKKAIDTYTLFLHYYGLMSSFSNYTIESRLLNKDYLDHRLKILNDEMLSNLSDEDKWKSFQTILQRIKDLLLLSRERDFTRGSRIIEDYESVHGTAAGDPFIMKITEEINILLNKNI